MTIKTEGVGRQVKPHRSGGGMPAPEPLPPLPNYLAKDANGVAFYDGFQMHQYAIRYAELCELSVIDPVAIARDRVGAELARKLDEEMYRAIAFHLKSDEFGFDLSDVRDRGRFVITQGSPVKTFCMDDTPLLEIYPIKSSMVGNVITYTQHIKKLYGTATKENS